MQFLSLLPFTSLVFPLPDDFQGKVVSIAGNVKERLVANGWAWHCKQYSTDAKLAQLETSAKTGGKGLWADPN
jgi:endonuclease YncB( thermonuclease family)